MSDKRIISADVKDKNGNVYKASMTVNERDSEVISDDDIQIMFWFAASNSACEVVGPITDCYA